MSAKVIPIRPALRRLATKPSSLAHAEPGFVVLTALGAEPKRVPAADALALAHAIETVALTAIAMEREGKRRG